MYSRSVRFCPSHHPPLEQELNFTSLVPTLSSPVMLGSPQCDAQDQPIRDSIILGISNAVSEGLPSSPRPQGPFSEQPNLVTGNACFKKRPLEPSPVQNDDVEDIGPLADVSCNTRICIRPASPITIHTYSSSLRLQAYRSRGLGNILASRDSARPDQIYRTRLSSSSLPARYPARGFRIGAAKQVIA